MILGTINSTNSRYIALMTLDVRNFSRVAAGVFRDGVSYMNNFTATFHVLPLESRPYTFLLLLGIFTSC
jgi:hypothetical protein